MKALLAGAALVAVLMVGDAFAQGSCSGACGSANSQCQRSAAQAGETCLRGCGGRPSCVGACEKQQRTVAGTCSRQYRTCLRGCGGR
jgi:hypothetical protein